MIVSATGTFIAVEVPVVTTIFAAVIGYTWRRRVAADDAWRAKVSKHMGTMSGHLIHAGLVETEFREDITELKRRRS